MPYFKSRIVSILDIIMNILKISLKENVDTVLKRDLRNFGCSLNYHNHIPNCQVEAKVRNLQYNFFLFGEFRHCYASYGVLD